MTKTEPQPTKRGGNHMPPGWMDWPSAWFVALEEAREQGDEVKVARAIYELRRLGVRVEFVAPAQGTGSR